MIQGKRASGILDTILILVFVFVFAIGAVIAFMIYTNINDAFQGNESIPEPVQSQMQDFDNRLPLFLDGGFLFFIFILWAGLIITSFLLDNHPAFFIMFFLLSIVIVFITIPLAKFLIAFSGNDAIAPYYDYFPITTFIINHFVILILFFIVSVGVALYAKNKVSV